MNKEQQELLDDAFGNYADTILSLGYQNLIAIGWPSNLEEFINKCKTDKEFSKQWGLEIEERELSDIESVFLYEKELYSPLRIIDKNIPVVPTKLVTITYNDKTIEVYE